MSARGTPHATDPSQDHRDRGPEAVRIRLLGAFTVSVGPRAIRQDEWRSKKAATLVKLLALASGYRMHRERAMDLLWPDSGKKAASNNLRQVVYGARRVLYSGSGSRESYSGLKDEQLVLCPGGQLWVDVDAFEGAASAARRSKDPSAYRAAIDLYAGDLLPGDCYEEWAEGRREQLRQLYLALLIELAGLYEGRGEHALAIEVLRKATTEEPTLEEAHSSLMCLYALSGRPERALAQYERLRDALQKGIGVRPTETTRRLREEIAAGRLPITPPAAPAQAEEQTSIGKHNLSAPRTSFVGREREIVDVKRALSMSRLLTLTGAGGTGKTRLALEVARDLVGTYPDGVWFVELAPLSEGGLVTQEVANALGVQERPGEPITATLVEVLAAKDMLLVLDNCEHLVEEAARLADALLASCPHLKMLATSREHLGVSGEIVWAVPPLSLPGGTTKGGLATESLLRYEAVRLFLDRARLRLPDFGLTKENASAVAGVCRKLEGMPLAIELATARMGALAVEQVAQRLEVSLDVLKKTGRTAAPRQRTLRATLDWSHDLLSDEERAFFSRLSVFAGGWTLEAAEAVCSGDGIEREDVLDLLGGLVDKSMVVAGASTGGAVRYRMLEPIRQYATEKLEEGAECEEVRCWHAEYFLSMAEEAEPRLRGPEEAAWLDRLEADHDNLRTALSWTLGGGAPELGLRLAAALSWFWDACGYFGEGTMRLEEALALSGTVAPAATRAEALTGLGAILSTHSGLERAEACLEEALALWEEIGNLGRIAECLNSLGWLVTTYRDDGVRAKAIFDKALAAARASGDERVIPNVLLGLGWFSFDSGDLGRAQGLWEEALAFAREQSNAWGISMVLMNMGHAELVQGNRDQAKVLLEEALQLGRKLGSEPVIADVLVTLGLAATLSCEPNRAKRLLREGLAIELRLGRKVTLAEGLEGLAVAAGALGEDVRAARLWGVAEVLRGEIGVPWRPEERLLHEPQLAAARSRLGEAAWEAAFTEGKAMTFEEAVEYALSKEEPDSSTSPIPRVSPADELLSSLTRREQEVAFLVARGFTNRQVAQELSISERTAANHVAKILRKLGLSSRTQIASWATQRQPLVPDQN